MWLILASSASAVVGGEQADPAVWPDAAAILDDEGTVFCSGLYLDPGVVLTAGHCVDAAVTVAYADGVRVEADRLPATAVLRGARHPSLDVGLLWTEGGPGAVARVERCAGVAIAVGDLLTVGGFGSDSDDGVGGTGTLREVQVTVVDPVCETTGRGCNVALPAGSELIAGGDGRDACVHDSGGPLVAGDGALVGVVSRGVLAAASTCGEGGVYTRLDAARAWIAEQGVGDCATPRRGCDQGAGMGWAALLALLGVRRRLVGVALLGVACVEPPTPSEEEEEPPGEDGVSTLAEIVAAPPSYGTYITVAPLRVTSTPSPLDGAVYLQDPTNGLGLQLLPGGLLATWPPPVGVDVQVRFAWAGSSRQPWGFLASDAAVVELGTRGEPVVAEPAVGVNFGLVRYAAASIGSWTDPTGRADLVAGDGRFRLWDRFLVGLPPAGNTGDVVVVQLPGGDRALRAAADWAGGWGPAQVVDATLGEALTLEEGAMARVEVTVVTPWSLGGRFAVVQDAGVGVWVDREAFAVGVDPAPGDRIVLQAEVRDDRGAPYLRSWAPPERVGVGDVTVVDELVDGAIVELAVTGLGPPDVAGERRAAEGWVLDNRFIDPDVLAALPPEVVVRAAVQVRPDLPVRLCVLP